MEGLECDVCSAKIKAADTILIATPEYNYSMIEGERARLHLRQCFVFLNMQAVNKHEVIVTFAPRRFDDKGRLIDEEVKGYIRMLFENLVALTLKLKTK